jgi:hypothetical protein
MADDTPDWADGTCSRCGEPRVDSQYNACYSCVSNERIARNAAKRAGPSARQREKQLEIEALMERDGEVRIALNTDV